ncbi:MAG TPA: ATP-binding cassette domain-containing protein [Deltaproteobacteria bacterium]|nr:ATP-binding cassette domain-containing protein [Deltaproteobacteria bacterium]
MNILEVKEVEYQYPDDTKALRGVNLEVKKGKKTAILGPNGAGKTTLLYLFNGTLKPSKGRIFLNGTPMRYDAKSLREVRRTVGMVFQNPDDQLFAPTVKQDVSFGPLNLKLPKEEIEKKVSECLKVVGMTGFERNPPHHLSTGQKKRVAIAGVLAMDPEILVFDEPLSGLDPRGQTELIELLDELNAEGKTIVVSTHDVDFASAWADEIYLLVKKRRG